MALDRIDAPGDPAHDCRGITGACAHFQNAVAGLHLGRLDHQSDDVRLRDCLTFADRKRPVLVSELFETGFNKSFARHTAHGLKD